LYGPDAETVGGVSGPDAETVGGVSGPDAETVGGVSGPDVPDHLPTPKCIPKNAVLYSAHGVAASWRSR
jgi:hypothetical protein